MAKTSKLVDRLRNEPGLGRNVGVVAAVIALALLTGGVILANQRVSWPWQRQKVLLAAFQDVPGVSANHGQEVRIAGVKVGTILSASIDSDGHAVLKMSLAPDVHVYDNATLVLRPKSPLNEMYVELNPGGAPGHELASGAKLPVTRSQRPIQVDEVLGHLDTNARSALGSVLSEADVALANASSEVPTGLDAADALARRLRPVAESLNQRKDSIARLITALSRIADAVGGDDGRLTSLVKSLQMTLDAMGSSSNALDSTLGQLPDLTTQLRQAMDAVSQLGSQLNPVLDNLHNASKDLPSALKRVTDTIDQVGTTTDQLKPVLDAAAPVFRDLRPLAHDLLDAAPDLKATTSHLDPVTGLLVNYLPDLGAFVENTHSVTSLNDANGGILRGLLEMTPSSVPAGLLPNVSPK